MNLYARKFYNPVAPLRTFEATEITGTFQRPGSEKNEYTAEFLGKWVREMFPS